MQVIENVPYSLKFFALPLKGGELSIYCRIIIHRKKVEIATGIRCGQGDSWNHEESTFDTSDPRSRYFLNRLREYEGKVYHCYVSIRNSGKKPTAAMMKEGITGKAKVGPPDLMEYISDYITRIKAQGELRPKTIGMYQVMYRYLGNYLKKAKLTGLRLDELRRPHLIGFQDYLLTTYNPLCKGPISRTSSNKYIKKLKVVLNDAIAREDLLRNPAAGFRLEQDRVNVDYLTHDEVKLIAEHPLGGCPNMDIVRKAFVFSCYSGLRFQDCFSLRRDQVYEQDGHLWVSVKQMKTKVRLRRPLFGPAVEVYRFFLGMYPHMETVLVPRSNQYVNRELKKIARMVGITDRKITFHTARHSHACLLIEEGVDLLTTSFFMGHSSTRSTEVYAKVTAKRALEVAQKFAAA